MKTEDDPDQFFLNELSISLSAGRREMKPATTAARYGGPVNGSNVVEG
jgi:hypothetical protein